MIAKIRKFLNGIEQASKLGNRFEGLERDNNELREKNSALWTSYNRKEAEASALSKELAALKAKAREQNEADLVLTSLKIIHGATRGETREQLAPLASLQAQQMAAMQNAYPGYPGNYGQSLLGMIAGYGAGIYP